MQTFFWAIFPLSVLLSDGGLKGYLIILSWPDSDLHIVRNCICITHEINKENKFCVKKKHEFHNFPQKKAFRFLDLYGKKERKKSREKVRLCVSK